MANYSDDIDAITTYIEDTRSLIPTTIGLADAITAYEQWLGGLSWYDRYIDGDTKFREAKWHRDKINDLLNRHLPDDYVPADAVTAASNPATKPSLIPTIPLKYKLMAAGAVGVGLLAFVGTLYVKAVMPPLPIPPRKN